MLLSLQHGDREKLPEVELPLHPNDKAVSTADRAPSGRRLSNLQSQHELEMRILARYMSGSGRRQVGIESMVTWLAFLEGTHAVYTRCS